MSDNDNLKLDRASKLALARSVVSIVGTGENRQVIGPWDRSKPRGAATTVSVHGYQAAQRYRAQWVVEIFADLAGLRYDEAGAERDGARTVADHMRYVE